MAVGGAAASASQGAAASAASAASGRYGPVNLVDSRGIFDSAGASASTADSASAAASANAAATAGASASTAAADADAAATASASASTADSADAAASAGASAGASASAAASPPAQPKPAVATPTSIPSTAPIAADAFPLAANIAGGLAGVTPTLTWQGAYSLSASGNIIVFSIDSLDEEYVNAILRDDPAFFKELGGFTRYTNNVTSFSAAYPGIIDLLSGYKGSDVQSFASYTDQAYRNDSFISEIRAQGYSSRLYMEYYYAYADIAQLEGLADNIMPLSYEVDAFGALANLARLSLLRSAPQVLKPLFQVEAADFSGLRHMASGSIPYESDDVAFYDGLMNNGLSVTQAGKGSFAYYHLFGSHAPYTMGPLVDRVSEAETGVIEQTRGCFNIIFEYLAQMKALGVYDDATIIITSEHPRIQMGEALTKPALTGLFVKTAGASAGPLRSSNAYVGIDMLRGTCVQAAGGDAAKWGGSYAEAGEGKAVERHYSHRRIGEDGSAVIDEYLIVGDARQWGNWRLVESKPCPDELWYY
jgi:hypothetical protein